MPAKSKDQQQAAAMALQAKKGQVSRSQLKGAAKEMFDSMSAKQLREYASTKTDSKPDKGAGPAESKPKKKPGRPPKKRRK